MIPQRPKTAKIKSLMHDFYLLQPILQFFALVALLLILSHCSPLAPSTPISALSPKNIQQSSSAATSATSKPSAGNSAISQILVASEVRETEVKDSTTLNATVMGDKDFDPNYSADVESVDFADEDSKNPSQAPLFTIFQNQEDLAALAFQGKLTIDLSKSLYNGDQAAQKSLFAAIKKKIQSGSSHYTVSVILPQTMVRDSVQKWNLAVTIHCILTDDNSARLELTSDAQQNSTNPSALEAVRDAQRLAIILQ